MLVAAFIGDDWRKVYRHAIENNYRFLSYGDSALLIPCRSQKSENSDIDFDDS
jgi:S-adenosylmethionine:tRNA-ribosyltransferase-isomerase (queuine synthetase)